jgi:aryl-alcohol dehydrogenase-like predicted oxidoreductase
METRRLGPTGPQISVVGFGSWEAGGSEWGPNDSDDQVIAAMRAGLDAGMNWIDTAEVYGPHRSEELVGRAVAGRDDILVFTKVAPDEEGSGGSGFRPDQVRQAIRGSLARLGRDHVDLYQLHWPDHSGVPMEDTWGAMAEIQDEGLARHIGVSNFSRQRIERCLAIRQVDSVQNEFSLVVQEDRAELLPWLGERGISYFAYSPMGAGILTGALAADHVFPDFDWRSGSLWDDEEQHEAFRPGVFEENLAKVERLRAIAERLGTTPAVLALRWVAEASPTTVAIAGSRDPGHARSNAQAGDLRLGAAILAEIDAVFG